MEGVLDIAGTPGSEVELVSADAFPEKSDWYGIRFQNTAESSDSTIRHAIIEHTHYAVRLTSSSPLLEDVEISLSGINGIYGQARSGVPFSPSRVSVSDAGTPVNVSNVSGTWTDVTLQNSTGDAGSISGGALDLRLVGLSVAYNDGGGLTTTIGGGGLEVILSEFIGNGIPDAGLTVNGNGPRTLVANDFENNGGTGLVTQQRFVRLAGNRRLRQQPGWEHRIRPADGDRLAAGGRTAQLVGSAECRDGQLPGQRFRNL